MLKLRTQSFRRYRISGSLPGPVSPEFSDRLTQRAFAPLGEADERTFGWTSADNLLVTEFHAGTLLRGEWAAFALRIDRRRVNPRLLRAHVELELEAHRQGSRDAGGTGRIGREERKAIREGIQARLLKETNPTIEHVPVLVHTKRRMAYVLALGSGVNDTVRALFLDTFGAELVPLTPWRRSVELFEGHPLAPALGQVQRTDFVGMPGEAEVPPARLAFEGDPSTDRSGEPRASASIPTTEEGSR